MATFEDIKVSEMTGLVEIPDTALVYIAIPGNTTPYKTTWGNLKDKLNYSEDFTWDPIENPDQVFAAPPGTKVCSVYLNRIRLFRSEYTLEDNVVTIIESLDKTETQIITITN